MPAPFNTIDLTTLALKSGEGTRLDIEVQPGSFRLGGQEYAFPAPRVPARLEISRTATGHAMHLTLDAALEGPCMRCLEPAGQPVHVDAREVDQPASEDPELTSPYVDGSELDIGAWSRDAIALALPQQLLCREDCAGLCPECGISLNDIDPAEHVHEREPDPRWARLRELME